MYQQLPIRDIYAREILDSRGNPTLEVEVLVGEYTIGRASVPSGASTGQFEAIELRDHDDRYHGKGVQLAVSHVNDELAKVVIGTNIFHQREIDHLLQRADGTENKGNLGANAILGVSLAAAHAASNALHLPLYQYLGGVNAQKLPIPMMNILNGGAHADNTLDIQEFMIMPVRQTSFKERLRMCAEVYQTLRNLLQENGLQTAVGDEGGFAPNLPDARAALSLISSAVEKSGYKMGSDIAIALDIAASELYNSDYKKYEFPGESKMAGKKVVRSTEELIDYYKELINEFPIVSIEDPLDEEDWNGWIEITRQLGDKIQLVGDDLFVTNVKRLEKGISLHAGNAILIKVNQIGTLSEAIAAIEMAKKNGYRTIISHRSGETEDTTIADIAVAFNAGQIKTGAPCRTERVAKYNRLLRIEEQCGEDISNL